MFEKTRDLLLQLRLRSEKPPFTLYEEDFADRLGASIEAIKVLAEKRGTLATEKHLEWVSNNKRSALAKRWNNEQKTYFFIGGPLHPRGAAHIHSGWRGNPGSMSSHRHTLTGWRKGDCVVFVNIAPLK